MIITIQFISFSPQQMLPHPQPLPNMGQHLLSAPKPQHMTLMNQNQQNMLPLHQQQQSITPNIPGNRLNLVTNQNENW